MSENDVNLNGPSTPAFQRSSSDKRYLPRWEVNNRILYKLESDPSLQECRSMDISCTGACLVTPDPLPAKQKVDLTVYLSETIAVKLQGQIVWQKQLNSGNLTGVLFTNTSPEVQELILDHAFEIKREDLVKHWFQGWNEQNKNVT